MFEKLKRCMPMYDHIIYIALDDCKDIEVVDDKFRDTDLEYRKEIDKLFRETIAKLRSLVAIEQDINGSRQERLKKFVSRYQYMMIEKDQL